MLRGIVGAVAALVLLVGCGSSMNDVVSTKGAGTSAVVVLPTATAAGVGQASSSAASTQTPTAVPTATSTPSPTPKAPTAPSPTPMPTPTPKPQALTLGSSGFGQQAGSRDLGWAFMVENPNAGQAIENSQYRIAVMDDAGTVLKTDSGYISVVLPSKRTAVAGTTILPEGAKAAKIDVSISQGKSEAVQATPGFSADKVTYQPDKYFPKASGIMSNPFKKDMQDVRVSAVAYDASGAIIGGGFTFLNFVPAQGKTGVSVSLDTSAAPAKVDLYGSISGLTLLSGGSSASGNVQPMALVAQGYGQLSSSTVGFGFIVQNPNTGKAFKRAQYHVTAYDDAGVVLGVDEGYIDLVLPGQKLGIGGDLSAPQGTLVKRIEVQVLGGDVQAADATPMFSTAKVTFVADKYSPKVTGIVKNSTAQTLKEVRASAIAYNDAGEIIGGGFTYIDFIPAQGQAAAEVGVHTNGTPSKVELYPVVSGLTTDS